MQSQIKVALSLAVVVLLSACRPVGTESAPSLPKVPRYAGARQIVVEPAHLGGGFSTQHTSFTTEDTPDSVLSFFRNALLSDRWTSGNQTPQKGTIFFLVQGCQLSTLEVITRRTDSGLTHVELNLNSQYCD